jgi:hypothetical protein
MPLVSKYSIARVDAPVELTGQVQGTAWERAQAGQIDLFLWYKAGLKQATTFRLLYDRDHLYAQFHCDDCHSSARTAELNGPVWLDSCVEVFAGPFADAPDYFNLEVNCIGAKLMEFGPGRKDRTRISSELAGRIRVAASLTGSHKQPQADDNGWWVAWALPFSVIAEMAGRPVTPEPGAGWHANFYRCGGQVDEQFACWSPIDRPGPDYHRPEFFGTIVFE